jgi:hypothetical protein
MRCNLNFILLTQSSLIGSAASSDDQDPFDLSFYTKGAAIGDSYVFSTRHGSLEADKVSSQDTLLASAPATNSRGPVPGMMALTETWLRFNLELSQRSLTSRTLLAAEPLFPTYTNKQQSFLPTKSLFSYRQ